MWTGFSGEFAKAVLAEDIERLFRKGREIETGRAPPNGIEEAKKHFWPPKTALKSRPRTLSLQRLTEQRC